VALILAAPPATPQGTQLAAMPPAPPTQGVDKKTHHLILQVNSNEPAMMNLALNNATNVEQYYKARGEKVEIEVVTFGPGLHMLRDDTSPVKDRINCVNAKLRNSVGQYRILVDPNCKHLIRDLEQVSWQADPYGNPMGTLDKSDKNRTHVSDALGYLVAREFPMQAIRGERSGPLMIC